MLTAVVLKLKPIRESLVPVSHYRFAYAAAIELISQVDRDLAVSLHDMDGTKPFTVSPLFTACDKRNPVSELNMLSERAGSSKTIPVTTADVIYWRLTGLTADVGQCFLSLQRYNSVLRIGQATFAVQDVFTTNDAHSAAGFISYEDFSHLFIAQDLARKITLHFITPTTFHYFSDDYPLPLPGLVWGSLFSKWQRFAPFSDGMPPEQFKEAAAQLLIPVNWHGETKRLIFGTRHAVTAFTGKFTYSLKHVPDDLKLLFTVLAGFAEFAGAGRMTAQGLGQVRCEFD